MANCRVPPPVRLDHLNRVVCVKNCPVLPGTKLLPHQCFHSAKLIGMDWERPSQYALNTRVQRRRRRSGNFMGDHLGGIGRDVAGREPGNDFSCTGLQKVLALPVPVEVSQLMLPGSLRVASAMVASSFRTSSFAPGLVP